MNKQLILGFALAAAAGGSQAVELYLNGPVVNAGGLSILTAPNTALGAGSTATQTLADNFMVTGPGWNVASLDFFAYQTAAAGTTNAFTFTSVTWSILAGADANTATTVASGTSAVTNGGINGAPVGFRVTSTTLTNTQRAIYRINADIPDVTLAAGSYFVTWALAGTSASGPFVPAVIGSEGTGNGLFNAGRASI